MPNVGPMEILLLAVFALLLFGPKRLPEIGRGVGKGLREFKDSLSGETSELRAALGSDDDEATNDHHAVIEHDQA